MIKALIRYREEKHMGEEERAMRRLELWNHKLRNPKLEDKEDAMA